MLICKYKLILLLKKQNILYNHVMHIKKVTKNLRDVFHKTYILALTQGFNPFVPKNFIKEFDKNFDESYKDYYNDKKSYLCLCFEQDQPIGVLVFGKSKIDGTNEDDAEIDSIYFLKKYHGLGFAKKAMEYMQKKLKEYGYSRICLWCSKENVRATKFYLKHGFVPTNKTWNDKLDGKIFHNLLYVKTI